jgi:predicted amidohydrolase YtcJ
LNAHDRALRASQQISRLVFARAFALVAIVLAPASVMPSFAAGTLLLVHGRIYTANPKAPWAGALAISGERIDAMGNDEEILKLRRANTKVIDLEGRLVIPGIVDTHTHMWYGALALHGFNLSTPNYNITPDSPEAFVDIIQIYAASHPAEKVLYGRGRFRLSVNHEILDRAVPDRPVVIHATSEHLMFVNARALALAGITERPLDDPALEKLIVRDSLGRPTGIVREGAMQLVNRAMPSMPREEKLALLRDASHYLNQFGITSVANATGDLAEIELYAALRDRGELTVRTRTAFGTVSVKHRLTAQFLAELEKARALYHDDWVSANLVKFFADDGDAFAYGPAEYQKLITELDKRGFGLVTHAIGSVPVHAVLDAYEELEKANGPRDRRLRMEHLFNIPAGDLQRFKGLSIVAGMQPSFCCGLTDPENKTHQWQSLEHTGAALTFSSDWPCTFPPDPMAGIQEAVTRGRFSEGHIGVVPPALFGARAPAEPTAVPAATSEHLTVEQAVAAYMRGAFAEFAEDRVGTLETGKYADLAVLSQDIFQAPPNLIGETHVDLTLVGGKTVYSRQLTPFPK